MRVRIQDVRAAGYCVRGLREKVEAYDLDLRRLVKEGLPYEEVEAKAGQDAQVQRVLEACRARHEGEEA